MAPGLNCAISVLSLDEVCARQVETQQDVIAVVGEY